MTDYALALATLPPADRETVLRWLEMLGLEPGELEACPPLRQLVLMVAALILTTDMPELSIEARFLEAGAALGDPTIGDSIARRLRAWRADAGRFVRDRSQDAA